MLKPEQIINAKFTPVSKGTYSSEEVDAFLKTVASEFEKSQAEKNELLKKISILADKIESYRSDEEAIKLALLDAHKMADSVNKTAKAKADEVVSDAEVKSKAIVDGANRQASQLIEEARGQARDIVDNAKNAVASLTERAQAETDRAVSSARAKANEIIAAAQSKSKDIIGNSREEFLKYSAAIEQAKKEAAEFKATLIELCKNELEKVEALPEDCVIVASDAGDNETVFAEKEVKTETVERITVEIEEEKEIPEVEESASLPDEVIFEPEIPAESEAAEEAEEALVSEQEPVTSAQTVYVPEQPEEEVLVPETQDDEGLDDLFSLIEDTQDDEAADIAADIDDFLPEITPVETVAEEAQPAEAEEEFDGFKVNLDEIADDGDTDDDEDDDDISSLFDSLF